MARATKKRAFFSLFCIECQEKDGKRHENYKVLLNTQNTNPKEFTTRKYCRYHGNYGMHKPKQISRAQNK